MPGIVGYLGDYTPSSPTDVDPRTLLADYPSVAIDVNANKTNPNTYTTGGVAEFEDWLAVAMQGSGTADAPFLLFYLDTTGLTSMQVSYNLVDIDGAADNAVQQVALHYRVGSSGSYTNLPGGYVADATEGPSLTGKTTAINVTLPADADNQPLVMLRVMTTNATGSDE